MSYKWEKKTTAGQGKDTFFNIFPKNKKIKAKFSKLVPVYQWRSPWRRRTAACWRRRTWSGSSGRSRCGTGCRGCCDSPALWRGCTASQWWWSTAAPSPCRTCTQGTQKLITCLYTSWVCQAEIQISFIRREVFALWTNSAVVEFFNNLRGLGTE